jgi:UDP-N-acetylglucosamine 2-epimerase (non-hydrolysing)
MASHPLTSLIPDGDQHHDRLLDEREAHRVSTSVPPDIDHAAERAHEPRAAVGPAGRGHEPQCVVPVVVGTRPEAIKLVPIILALRESEHLHPLVVSTGQHHELVQEIFGLAGIEVDTTLWTGPRSGLNERVTSVMQRFEDFMVQRFGLALDGRVHTVEDVLHGRFPAAVFVHGDTSSAMAAALAAFHLRIPVLHVEAGLRTGGLNLTPFPEELNRQLISCIAALHFAPTARNEEALIRENVPVEQIYVTGNTGIDALAWASSLGVLPEDPALRELCESGERFVVVTAHRRESWAHGLDGIAEGIARLGAAHPAVRFVVPLHPNPLVREKLGAPLRDIENVLLCEPVSYAPFATLLGRCHLVITDSGGIQEEAPALGKPVLVTREETERQEGVDAGTLRLVGTHPDRIFAEADRLLGDDAAWSEMAAAPNPYGDGHAAARIVAACEFIVRGGAAPAPFGSGFTRNAVIEATGFERPLARPGDGAAAPADLSDAA